VRGRRRLSLLAAAALVACPSPVPVPDESEITVVVQADRSQTQMEERILRAKREELERERLRIQDEIAKLRALAEKGARPGDYAQRMQELESKAAELLAREQALERERQRLAAEAGDKTEALPAALVGGGSLAVREEELARREGALADRERLIAARELELAQREREVALREEKLQRAMASGLGSSPIPPVPIGGAFGSPGRAGSGGGTPAGGGGGGGTGAGTPFAPVEALPPRPAETGSGNRVAVEAWHEKVLNDMLSKGILWSDLPGHAQGLNGEIWNARRANDWNRAGEMVAKLIAAVDAVKVDGNFISEKIKRVTASSSIERLDAKRKDQVDRLLREVELKFGDGRFSEANRDINRIVQLLEAGS
jgi:hypothetical protein